MLIKTGYLVAYDYDMLRISLPCIYSSSDIICLCIDIERKTWSGNTFEINPDFFIWIYAFDKDKKIIIYEDSFYNKELSPKVMETIQRQKMANKLGLDGWHIQLDVDEYFINFDLFVSSLKKIKKKSVGVYVKWKTIFKEDKNGFFVIAEHQYVPVATNNPQYSICRITSNKKRINLNYFMLHQSWGRKVEDVYKKLKNWGHADDFDTEKFFEFWKSVSVFNYKYLKNFHPLNPKAWSSIDYIEEKNILKIQDRLSKEMPLTHSFNFLTKHLGLFIPPIFFKLFLYFKKR